MKYRLSRLLLPLFLLLTVTGCDREEEVLTASGYIASAELTSQEETLLKAVTGSKYLVYDIDITDDEIGWIEYWIEFYRNGSAEKRILGAGSRIDQPREEPQRLLITFSFDSDEQEETWNVALIHGDSMTRSNTSTEMPVRSPYSMTWEQADHQDIFFEDEIALAAIVAEDGSSSGVGISSSNLEDDDGLDRIIETNQYVYLIKCRFTEIPENE